MSLNNEVWQNHEAAPRRTEEKPFSSMQKEAGFQAPAEQNQVEPREPEERQVEEEHRKALEEEEMEQVGQAEHLEEEHDPSPEEQDREWRDQQGQDAAHLLDGRPQAEVHGYSKFSLMGNLALVLGTNETTVGLWRCSVSGVQAWRP